VAETSLALRNLRALTILLVVGFHSVLAYNAWQPALMPPFDAPPFDWRAFPILDPERWFGFDLFCAFQYVFLMPLMFFLSGLFVWPSLRRKGVRTFLFGRLLRLGIPFVVGVYLLMPLAHYPVYRVGATDPSWGTFWAQWTALPFWASGPLWFLWQLLVLDCLAGALYGFPRRVGRLLVDLSEFGLRSPARYVAGFVVISTLAYAALGFVFKPWDLEQFGPLAYQPGRLLQYAVYFFAGVGVGSVALGEGLLRADGWLPSRWRACFGIGLGCFVLWMAATGVTMAYHGGAAPVFEILADIFFGVSGATAALGLIAIFLRFARHSSSVAESLSENAYGIYLIHYVFVIWLQYFALDLALPAVGKAVIVFGGALGLSWGASIVLGQMPGSGFLIRTERSRRASGTPAE
jgi:surface polysaccharide O-acyltransferase-like enzyme